MAVEPLPRAPGVRGCGAAPRAEGALPSDRGEPAMSARAIQRRTELTSGKLRFLGIEASKADLCIPASGSLPAGNKVAVLKQITEAASVFFNIVVTESEGM